MSRLFVACFLGVMIVTQSFCTGAEPLAGDDEVAIRKKLSMRNEAWTREDVAELADGFTPNADYVDSAGNYYAGRKNLKRMYESLFSSGNFRNAKIEQDVTRIRMLTSDTALIDATWSYKLEGSDVDPKSGSSFLVMQKTSGEWKIAALRVAAGSTEE